MPYSNGGKNQVKISTSAAIAETIVARKGVDPADLEPLYKSIDPEALNTLFAPQNDETVGTTGQIIFTHAGYEIIVNSDRSITVDSMNEEE